MATRKISQREARAAVRRARELEELVIRQRREWLREGQALPFCLSEFGGNAEDDKQFAEAAYQISDAMLAERDK